MKGTLLISHKKPLFSTVSTLALESRLPTPQNWNKRQTPSFVDHLTRLTASNLYIQSSWFLFLFSYSWWQRSAPRLLGLFQGLWSWPWCAKLPFRTPRFAFFGKNSLWSSQLGELHREGLSKTMYTLGIAHPLSALVKVPHGFVLAHASGVWSLFLFKAQLPS